MSSAQADFVYKMVVLGGGGVGKSALTVQFVANHFVESYDPTIEDSYRRQLVLDNDAAVAEVIDTAGQEEFSALRDSYMRSGEAFIIVFDLLSRASFEETTKLREQVLRANDTDALPIILVGNKTDLAEQRDADGELRRRVSTTEGEDLARAWNCTYLETSAYTRHNVDEVFFHAVRAVRRQRKNPLGAASSSRGKTSSSKSSTRRSVKQLTGCSIM